MHTDLGAVVWIVNVYTCLAYRLGDNMMSIFIKTSSISEALTVIPAIFFLLWKICMRITSCWLPAPVAWRTYHLTLNLLFTDIARGKANWYLLPLIFFYLHPNIFSNPSPCLQPPASTNIFPFILQYPFFLTLSIIYNHLLFWLKLLLISLCREPQDIENVGYLEWK